MTSLALWVGHDSRGHTSAYIATDSRLSDTNGNRWDFAQKAFACMRSPDIFGYTGVSQFPTILLSAFTKSLDEGTAGDASSAKRRFEALIQTTKTVLDDYPPAKCWPAGPFTIVHVGKDGHGHSKKSPETQARFVVNVMSYKDGDFAFRTDALPTVESSYLTLGSGKTSVEEFVDLWKASPEAGNTTRAVYSGFCESLRSEQDPLSGGAPQVVRLLRSKKAPRVCGTWWDGRGYLHGHPVRSPGKVDWFDDLFQRIDGATGKRLASAEPHANRRSAGPVAAT
ncbi:MAG: hypothetical protein JWL76_383 [Thermoleophilia bacterium]|nr:hypothetical protein [Thermoleophilia bacterium]